MNKDEAANGPLPVNMQCKTQCRSTNYPKLLDEMPKGRNAVVHQFTKKSAEGKFMVKGEYAVLDLDFFIELLTAWESNSQTSLDQ